MTYSTDSTYLLGGTSAEYERLIRQAHIYGPFTERLFRDAGVKAGQRVLDIGSGVGDVALLAARLEREPNTIATASSRASAVSATTQTSSDTSTIFFPRYCRVCGNMGSR